MKSFFFYHMKKWNILNSSQKQQLCSEEHFHMQKWSLFVVVQMQVVLNASLFHPPNRSKCTQLTHMQTLHHAHMKGEKLSRILICCYRPVTKAFNTYSCYSTITTETLTFIHKYMKIGVSSIDFSCILFWISFFFQK